MHYKDTESLKKRAGKKLISESVATNLFWHNPHSPLRRSYDNATHCCEVLEQKGDKIISTYCKCRWCAVCGAIRTAKAIKGYAPQLKTFQDLYFVTLTKQTVMGYDLPDSIAFMGESWRKITNLARSKQWGMAGFRGVKKDECTQRPHDHYHYHFHVMIDGKENAQWLVSQWLRLMGNQASIDGQDIRPADERSFKELFKYFTKLTFTIKDEERGFLPFDRMDVIYQALAGKKTFYPFGGLRMASEEVEELTSESFDNLDDEYQYWLWERCDWVSEVGKLLTGYKPTPEVAKLYLSPSDRPALVDMTGRIISSSHSCSH